MLQETSIPFGWLAWCRGDLEQCDRWWRRGIEFGRQLLSHSIDETLINPVFPNLHCAGDGMRELVHALEDVGRCGHGLHALELRRRGISCDSKQIFGSFRQERDDAVLVSQLAHAHLMKVKNAVREEPEVFFSQGFHSPEGDYRWMTASGFIEVCLKKSATLTCDLQCSEAAFYEEWPLVVTISTDGVTQVVIAFESSQQSRSAEVLLTAGTHLLNFSANGAFVPKRQGAGEDMRELSVRLSGLVFLQKDPGMSPVSTEAIHPVSAVR